MPLKVMVSRHSAFYSPLIAAVKDLGATYAVLGPGQRSQDLIRSGAVDIMQSAVSSNWKPMERGEGPLPVHFALINRRDGFYIVGREPSASFNWRKLEGRGLLADHGGQPLAMLRYAVHHNGVDWRNINVVDRGAPEDMMAAFRHGVGDYIHLQAPAPQILEEDGVGWTLASVGASMPEVAFSTICCSRGFARTEQFRAFVPAYVKAREWVRSAPPAEVAAQVASLFPGMSQSALGAAVGRYRQLGNWAGSIEITHELYEQALNVFAFSGGIAQRHPWAEVCIKPCC